MALGQRARGAVQAANDQKIVLLVVCGVDGALSDGGEGFADRELGCFEKAVACVAGEALDLVFDLLDDSAVRDGGGARAGAWIFVA